MCKCQFPELVKDYSTRIDKICPIFAWSCTRGELSAVSNQVALKADAATVDLGLAQKASVALEHAVKLDGDASLVTGQHFD